MITDTGERLRLEIYNRPDNRLAQAAAAVGFDAWHERFVVQGNRTTHGVRHMFDPRHPERTLASMQRAAKINRFAGVVAIASDGETEGVAGALWGADDISGPVSTHDIKRKIGREYAWVAQANVRPAWWHKGIGGAMLLAFLGEFGSHQATTSYVFRENGPGLKTFENWGYQQSGARPHRYFGRLSRPVELVRLVADAGNIRMNLNARGADQIADEVVGVV